MEGLFDPVTMLRKAAGGSDDALSDAGGGNETTLDLAGRLLSTPNVYGAQRRRRWQRRSNVRGFRNCARIKSRLVQLVVDSSLSPRQTRARARGCRSSRRASSSSSGR